MALVTPEGWVIPRGDGQATIVVRHGELEAKAEVTVTGFSQPDPVDFRTEAIAALGPARLQSGCLSTARRKARTASASACEAFFPIWIFKR